MCCEISYSLKIISSLRRHKGQLNFGVWGAATGRELMPNLPIAALPMALPVFNFPHPSGPYAIGALTYHWIDANRVDVSTANPHDHPELSVDSQES